MPTHFIQLYDPRDLENKIKVTKIWSYIKFLLMVYLCKLGQNLAISSEECKICYFIELYDPGNLEN